MVLPSAVDVDAVDPVAAAVMGVAVAAVPLRAVAIALKAKAAVVDRGGADAANLMAEAVEAVRQARPHRRRLQAQHLAEPLTDPVEVEDVVDREDAAVMNPPVPSAVVAEGADAEAMIALAIATPKAAGARGAARDRNATMARSHARVSRGRHPMTSSAAGATSRFRCPAVSVPRSPSPTTIEKSNGPGICPSSRTVIPIPSQPI